MNLSGTICWHKIGTWREDGTECRDPNYHRGAPVFYWGRCRSGRRWFWAVENLSWSTDSVDRAEGWEDSEEAATDAARAAIERMAAGRRASAHLRSYTASRRLKELNAEKRRAKPAAKTGETRATEYLYGETSYISDYDNSYVHHVHEFQVTRKTAKRIYYIREPQRVYHDNDGSELVSPPEVGFVDRQEIESKGEVRNRGVHWSARDSRLYLKPPAPPEHWQRPQRDPQELKRLKREMADAHPDHGGSSETFIAARHRYVAARAKAGLAS